MRPKGYRAFVGVLLFLLLGPALTAETPEAPATPPTPRQAFQRAEALFSQGHTFTAEEFTALDTLRQQLVDTGDEDWAADLDLLRLGAATQAVAAEARARSLASLPEDADQWAARERVLRDRGFWRGVRDAGLTSFTLATMATLLLAVVNERNDLTLQNGFFTDRANRDAFTNRMHWAMAATGSAMFLSLFPLLWGEARQ